MRIKVPLQGTLYTNPQGYEWAPDEDPVMYSPILRQLVGDDHDISCRVMSTDYQNGTVDIEIKASVGRRIIVAIAQRDPDALRQAMGKNFVHEQLDLPGNPKLFRLHHDVRTKEQDNAR